MSGKRNVSVYRGHELANALYVERLKKCEPRLWFRRFLKGCVAGTDATADDKQFQFPGLRKLIVFCGFSRLVATTREKIALVPTFLKT